MIKTYRGRPFADWVVRFFDLDPTIEYSFHELSYIFDKPRAAIECQVRRIGVKVNSYQKIHKKSRIALFLGQDLIDGVKKKLLIETGLLDELIVSDIKKIAKRKEKLEHKVNLFLAISAKSDKNIAKELRKILEK